MKISTLKIIFFSSGIFFFFSESMKKKGSGGRITSLTLEKKGDGKEGGRGRGWLGDATGAAAARAAAGYGGRAGGRGPATWRAAERRVGRSVGRSEAGGGGGGPSPHCARSSCGRRLDPAAMAAAVAAEAAPFRPQAAAPRLLPIRRGHGSPATASVPRGPLPRPRHQRGRPPAPRLCARCLRSGSVRAGLPVRSPCHSGCGAGSSRRPSFLPSGLPSFVTRPGRRRRRRQHKPAFARVRGCSV